MDECLWNKVKVVSRWGWVCWRTEATRGGRVELGVRNVDFQAVLF